MRVVEPENYSNLTYGRATTLYFEYRLYKEELVAGDIVIFNLESFKPHHYAKLFDITCLKLVKFILLNFPYRIKHVLIVNCHSLLEKGINLCKSVVPEKMANRVSIVSPKDLEKYVPLDCLPEDFGGSQKSVKYFSQAWRDLLMEHEDLFLEIGKAKPTGPIPEDVEVYEHEFGVEGSFRQLNID